MVELTLADVLKIRDEVSATYHDRFEVMHMHALLSALAAPDRSAFGQEVFRTLAEKAAALLYALVQHHPFWDGNKRIATAALCLFLRRNGVVLVAGEVDFEMLTTSVARGELQDADIAAWIARRSKAAS